MGPPIQSFRVLMERDYVPDDTYYDIHNNEDYWNAKAQIFAEWMMDMGYWSGK